MSDDQLVLGIDIGGTKMAVGLVNQLGDVIVSGRTPTPARSSGDEMLGALFAICSDVMEQGGNPEINGVGVGCAGPMVWPDGVVSPLNIPAWRQFPLRQALRARFPGQRVHIHNDAIAMAAAEHWKGAAVGYSNMLGMVVSTGVGGGFIMDNRLIHGGLGNAGHIGHIVVDPNGPICPCGGQGCLETIARGPAITAWAIEEGWNPSAAPTSGATAKVLAEDARNGDEIAIAAFERSGEAVGVALASVASLLDLDVAVIGGGLIQTGPLLMRPLKRSFEHHAGLAFAKRMGIVPAALDQDAGIVGAAALILRAEQYWTVHDD